MEWRDADSDCWWASFGDELQGSAAVGPVEAGQFRWVVDVLPGDPEDALTGLAPCADTAKAAAERQVAAWPTLIEGARRV